MDGFKTLPKMAHFKTGGSVKTEDYCGGGKAMKAGGHAESEEMGEDLAQDKKLIKKAFKQHDKAEHDKEPTEIKLKKGGRSKKEDGSVRKYKSGGTIENVYGAKKASGDLDRIKKTKDIMPEEADAASGAKGGPNKYKKGGNVKKYDIGGSVMDAIRGAGTRLKNNVMGTDAQNAQAEIEKARYLKAKQMQEAAGKEMGTGEKMAMGLAGLGKGAPVAPAPVDTMSNVTGMPAQKRGGKVKKMNTGGTAS